MLTSDRSRKLAMPPHNLIADLKSYEPELIGAWRTQT
jgi:hypothetical protein